MFERQISINLFYLTDYLPNKSNIIKQYLILNQVQNMAIISTIQIMPQSNQTGRTIIKILFIDSIFCIISDDSKVQLIIAQSKSTNILSQNLLFINTTTSLSIYSYLPRFQNNNTNNNYNTKMKNKHRRYTELSTHSRQDTRQYQTNPTYQPVKSPSPDKKSSNVIAVTRSPQMRDISRHITPIREDPTASRIYQKIQQKEKQINGQVTPKQQKGSVEIVFSYKNEQTLNTNKRQQDYQSSINKYQQHYSQQNNSYSKNINAVNSHEYVPQAFQLSSDRQSYQQYQIPSEPTELNYAKMLRQKQQTIKELKELLQMINSNNERGSDSRETQSNIQQLQEKLLEYGDQIKILRIQNQKLISVIENNHVNLPSNKEEILQRQIKQLRESLKNKQDQCEQIVYSFKAKVEVLQNNNRGLEGENQKLMKVVKNKEVIEKSNQKIGMGSQSYSSKSIEKEKITLTKIKEQYHQNLKLIQENFKSELGQSYGAYQASFQELAVKLNQMGKKVLELEEFKREAQSKIAKKQQKHHKYEKQQRQQKKAISAQVPKDQHLQIESLLLQKFSKKQKQLNEQKVFNQKLSMELSIVQKNYEQLKSSFNYSQQFSNRSKQFLDDSIDRSALQKNQLKNQIKLLEEQNIRLRQSYLQLQEQKQSQCNNLESKIQTIVAVYEQNLSSTKSTHYETIKLLQAQLKESVDCCKAQSDQNEIQRKDIQQKLSSIISSYDRQIQQYKSLLQWRNKQMARLNEENTKMKNQLEESLTGRGIQNQKQMGRLRGQNESIQRKCSQLENGREELILQIKQIKKAFNQLQLQRNLFNSSKISYESQIDKMNKQLAYLIGVQKQNQEIKIHLDHFHSQNQIQAEKIEILQKKVAGSDAGYNSLLASSQQEILQKNDIIDDLKHQLIQQDQQLTQLKIFYDKFKRDRSIFNYQTLQAELNELKKIIIQFQNSNSGKVNSELLQKYYLLQNVLEGKIQENYKLQRQIQSLKQRIGKEQRQKIVFEQKNSCLEKNITIYQSELKERKILYQSLLQQKSKFQKQTLLSKKIKASQYNEETNKSSINQINSRMDCILDLQRKRTSKIQSLFEKKQPFYYSPN